MKIILIEDNQTIAVQMAEFLAGHGWEVDHSPTAEHGIRLALDHIYDVILLDLTLPDRDGLEVCSTIKREALVTPPILMVTARDSFEDKAAGFREGADDYLIKPFDLRELALRCQALARRQALHQAKEICLGDLRLHLNSREAFRAGMPLQLTSIGFQILVLLARAYPEPASRSFISHQLWGDSPPDSDALKSHIYALRKALDTPFTKPMLETVMNVGFKLIV